MSNDRNKKGSPEGRGRSGGRPPKNDPRRDADKPYSYSEFDRGTDSSSKKKDGFDKGARSFDKKPFKKDFDKSKDSRGGSRSYGDKPAFDKKPYGRDSDRSSDNRGSSRNYGDKQAFDKKPYGKDFGPSKDGRGDRHNDKAGFDKKPFKKDFDKDRSKFEEGKSKKNKHFMSAEERQVGASKPPRYDEEQLIKKVPQRFKEKVVKAISENEKDDDVRLNRYIANSGVCSRREADELIASGMIRVNGKVVTEMGYKVKDTDTVKYGNDILSRERMMYILLNKPKDYITTMDDPEERKTVIDLVKGACRERVFPVGRLDRNTTGLLLLTNDGELTEKLTHPSNSIKKIYQAELDKPISEEHFDMIKAGFELEDGFVKADALALVTPDAEVVGIEIHSGKNRIVRRIFEHFGYEVKKLDRTTFAGLTKKDVPRGKWRFLTENEVIRLKYLL